uniref:Uncharacterized protein n=1 Tax=Setaria digitata TaxID=48799 RepID=A0A915PIS2_9BILA
MYRPDGQPRKCLPHQNSLCVNALPDQVDYFCCLDVTPLDCPDYHNVTVVVHNAYPQNPFALRSFHFRCYISQQCPNSTPVVKMSTLEREGIEDEIAAMTQELIRDNAAHNENGILARHNSAQN